MSCKTKSMMLVSEWVNPFPISAVINYDKLSGFEEHTFIFLRFCRSQIWNGFPGLKTKVIAELCFFFEALGENLFSCLFQLLRTTCILGAHFLWFHLQSQEFSIFKFPSVNALLFCLSSTLKDPCNDNEPTEII